MKDILKIKSGSDYKNFSPGNIPVIGSSGSTISYINKCIYSCQSVLIGRKGTINKPIYVDYPFWVIDTMFYSEIHQNNYPKFIYYLFLTIKWERYSEQTGVPSLTSNAIHNILCFLPLHIIEQQKIAKFFSLLDKQIELWETKLKLNEQIFNYLYNRKFNEIKNFKKVPFASVFTEYSIKNIDGLDQYTIGKNGIKPINNPKNYDILNHKLFLKNSLVLGIGCNEISFNIDIKGSCSPIYKTFKLNNEYLFLNHYLYFFIKKYLNYRKQYFCKKSTRREWEIENNLLKKEYIPIMENISFVKMFQNIEKLCEWYSVKILELYKIKKYYLEQIII